MTSDIQHSVSSHTAAIVGGIVGGAAVVTAIFIGIRYCYLRKLRPRVLSSIDLLEESHAAASQTFHPVLYTSTPVVEELSRTWNETDERGKRHAFLMRLTLTSQPSDFRTDGLANAVSTAFSQQKSVAVELALH